MLSVEQLPSRYFVTAANFISKEYFECCPIKYAPPYSDSFIILSVYYKGSISKSQFAGSLYVQESNFTKSADCVLLLTKGIVIECKVCQQQDRFKRRFKLLSPSIYYGAYYAVEVILSLIYAALRTLE